MTLAQAQARETGKYLLIMLVIIQYVRSWYTPLACILLMDWFSYVQQLNRISPWQGHVGHTLNLAREVSQSRTNLRGH